MKKPLFIAVICLCLWSVSVRSEDCNTTAHHEIDRIVFCNLEKRGIKPADPITDDVFLRRVYIDLTGTIPDFQVAREFLADEGKNKRQALIDRLMQTPEFSDYWTLKWCDLLRVKSEFPIKMWPNGVQAYARWILGSIAENKPYDKFARELLTSSGSNFRMPAVNFYRGVQSEKPGDIASAVALTFMGTRLEKWPENKRKDMEAFFSRVRFKSTAEWKEIIVHNDPAVVEIMETRLPDGRKVKIEAGMDPRVVFADWLISDRNEWFARNIVNRAWSWFFGYGLIHEPDDITVDSKAVYPELLEHLENELISSGYDMRHLFRTILLSGVYQQSAKPSSELPGGPELFARYPVRQLDAEVLIDALDRLSGSSDEYMSMIPEPFTFIPAANRAVQLVDGSITSEFLKMFGRPSRDTGLESERSNAPTEEQRLHMLNSTHIQTKIEKGWKLRNLVVNSNNKKEAMDILYLSVLTRYPTEEELLTARDFVQKNRKQNAAGDLFWALINSKEFLYRH